MLVPCLLISSTPISNTFLCLSTISQARFQRKSESLGQCFKFGSRRVLFLGPFHQSSGRIRIYLLSPWLTPHLTAQCQKHSLIYLKSFMLDISRNALSGTLPSDFPSRWSKLQQRVTSQQQLHGPTSNKYRLFVRALFLGLSFNNFTGPIPDSLLNISALELLTLEGNGFSGTLPNDWSRLPVLALLSFTDNKLTGSLPPVHGEHDLHHIIKFCQQFFQFYYPRRAWEPDACSEHTISRE